MSYNHAIRSDDPQAVEKLTAKLESCQERQAFMKSVNSFYRKMGLPMGAPACPRKPPSGWTKLSVPAIPG